MIARDPLASVRDRELLDLIQQLEKVEEELIETYIPDDFIGSLTNNARAVITKAITYLCELRARNGGAAP
jgi:hypothetical protein